MQLEDKVAVIYGAGGAIGGAVARAFAREGARVFLAGRTPARLEAVAREIAAAGGAVEVTPVDALDEQAVHRHADAVAAKAGRIDIALNAVGIPHVQGTPFAQLSLEDFALPINAYLRSYFITAQAVARHMAKHKSGVILTLSTPGAKMTGSGFIGNGVTSAATEWFSRLLAAELAPSGIRVVCLRPHAIPEAVVMGSYTGEVFKSNAASAGMAMDDWLAGAAAGTLTQRLPTLAQVADTAVFMASASAGAMTGTVVNLTSGTVLD